MHEIEYMQEDTVTAKVILKDRFILGERNTITANRLPGRDSNPRQGG